MFIWMTRIGKSTETKSSSCQGSKWLPGASLGWGWEVTTDENGVSFLRWSKYKIDCVDRGTTLCLILKTFQLHTVNELIVWYVNYISTKLLIKTKTNKTKTSALLCHLTTQLYVSTSRTILILILETSMYIPWI